MTLLLLLLLVSWEQRWACVYASIRQKFRTEHTTGYRSAQERARTLLQMTYFCYQYDKKSANVVTWKDKGYEYLSSVWKNNKKLTICEMSAEKSVEQSCTVWEQAPQSAFFLAELIDLYLPLIWLVVCVRNSRLRSRYGTKGWCHWRVKSPRCRRSKRVYVCHTTTSFGKECIEIPGIWVLFFRLTSFGTPATQYVRPCFYISPFSTVVADVSSQFSTSQLCNMNIFAARLVGTFFGQQIALSKKPQENLLSAKVGYF